MNLFDIPKLEQDLKTLESKTLEDGFWNDSKKSGKVLGEYSGFLIFSEKRQIFET